MYTTCNYIVLDKKKVTMYYYNYYVAVLTISWHILSDDEVVQDFLEADSCMKISDKVITFFLFSLKIVFSYD